MTSLKKPDSANPVELRIRINDIIKRLSYSASEEDLAILDVGGPIPKNPAPTRIDAFLICLVLSGKASVKIDLREYETESGSLIQLSPKNYITDFCSSEDFHAKVIICTPVILEHILPKLTEYIPVLINQPFTPVSRLAPDEVRSLEEYCRKLERDLTKPASLFKKQKLICLLHAMMLEILEIRHKDPASVNIKKSRKEELMAKFIIAVSEHFRTHREVAFYANQLCITPKHLSAVVKEISGRPAGEWIDQYVVMEAKVLLRNTDHTIQQIASILNFANQSFFGKYFKHMTGISPTAFRNTAP